MKEVCKCNLFVNGSGLAANHGEVVGFVLELNSLQLVACSIGGAVEHCLCWHG
jgi:hypothetical protein